MNESVNSSTTKDGVVAPMKKIEDQNELQKEQCDNVDVEQEQQKATKKRKVRRLDMAQVADYNEKLRKRGVIYLARVPPAMGPAKVKSLMSDFGEVTRVFLVEEDASARKRRRRAGGNGSKRYVEGWVEFAERWVAQRVGETVNNTPITNSKRSKHFGDMWNVKFLRKFQWSHLTEKVAYERRMREQKLMVEMMQAKKENAAYIALVEAGRKIDKIEQKRRQKAEKKGLPVQDIPKTVPFQQITPVEPEKRSGDKAVLESLVSF
jgi:ESF2/ABP1 family protein